MEKKYKALRLIAFVNKVLALVVAVLSILTAIVIFVMAVLGGVAADNLSRQLNQSTGGLHLFTGVVGGLFLTLLPLISGGLLAISLYAFGEFIYVLIDIEANTRTTGESITTFLGYMGEQVRFRAPQPVSSSPAPLPSAGVVPQNLASLPPLPEYNICPQCGAKVNTTDINCPECGYVFRDGAIIGAVLRP